MTDSQPSDEITALAAELRSLVSRLKRRLREQGNIGDFTPSQVAVLLRLERDGASTVSSLARQEEMRPQSMSAIIAPLQAAQLVSGASDPADGRQILITLTDRCRRRLDEGRAAREDWLSRTIQARLSADERNELSQSLRLLGRLID